MKVTILTVFSLFCLAFCPLWAQSQEGSVAIASAIRPEKDTVVADFTTCVTAMKVAGATFKEAAKSCKEIAKVATNVTTRLANEAADATKASRPMVVMGGYGYRNYGYGTSYGYGRSYNYSRPTVVRRRPPPPRNR